MKKALKVIGISVLILVVIMIMVTEYSLPNLPQNTDRILNELVTREVSPLTGNTGFAQNGEVSIWYESREPEDTIRGSILLIMGLANDALSWPEYFIDPFVEAGYRVVRFDNRGTGLSDWMEDWSRSNPYSLDDMSRDGLAVMDTLGIEKAHVIGASLGGMIAQHMAIHWPEKVASLISMMSTGDIMDDSLPGISKSLLSKLALAHLKYGWPATEKNAIREVLTVRLLLMGEKKYDMDIEQIGMEVLYNIRKRKGYNVLSGEQQSYAVIQSGPRYEGLAKLGVPTLVIHGTGDPMIDIVHGKKVYHTVPGAEKLWVDGMGHELPEIYNDEVVEAILHFLSDK